MTTTRLSGFWDHQHKALLAQMGLTENVPNPAPEGQHQPTMMSALVQPEGASVHAPAVGVKLATFQPGDTWEVVSGARYRIESHSDDGLIEYSRQYTRNDWFEVQPQRLPVGKWREWLWAIGPKKVESSPTVVSSTVQHPEPARGATDAGTITFTTKAAAGNVTINAEAYQRSTRVMYAGTTHPRPPHPSHDYTDPYCVKVSEYGTTRLCKHCGIVAASGYAWDPCEPYNWRAADDEGHRRVMDVTARKPPEPPRYAAPELRAANMWSCGLGRSQR